MKYIKQLLNKVKSLFQKYSTEVLDTVEHVVVIGVLFGVFSALYFLPFPIGPALAAGIAGLATEFKESQAKQWYIDKMFGKENLKKAFARTMGRGDDPERLDTLKDWAVPLTFWLIVAILLAL